MEGGGATGGYLHTLFLCITVYKKVSSWYISTAYEREKYHVNYCFEIVVQIKYINVC